MTLDELKFKAGDFPGLCTCEKMPHEEKCPIFYAEKKANRILEEKLKRAPEVFGPRDHLFLKDATPWTIKKHPIDTHKARLVCIEEIEK